MRVLATCKRKTRACGKTSENSNKTGRKNYITSQFTYASAGPQNMWRFDLRVRFYHFYSVCFFTIYLYVYDYAFNNDYYHYFDYDFHYVPDVFCILLLLASSSPSYTLL